MKYKVILIEELGALTGGWSSPDAVQKLQKELDYRSSEGWRLQSSQPITLGGDFISLLCIFERDE